MHNPSQGTSEKQRACSMWALPALVSCKQTMEDLAKAGAALTSVHHLAALLWDASNMVVGMQGLKLNTTDSTR